jgi:hypothetical protein
MKKHRSDVHSSKRKTFGFFKTVHPRRREVILILIPMMFQGIPLTSFQPFFHLILKTEAAEWIGDE